MRRLLFAASLTGTVMFGMWASPGIGQENVDQQFGTVHFATSCNETAQRRFDRAMRYQHSFWYKASKAIFEEVLKADPECGIAYWGIALGLVDNPHYWAACAQSTTRPRRHSSGESERRQDPARTRLYRRAGAVVCRLRQDDPRGAHSILPQSHGSAGLTLSRRRRGADPVRDHAQRRGLADRQDLCQSAERGGHPRADFQASAPPPGRRSLSYSPVRLSGDRREGARCGAALRRDCAGGTACAAHALAHLHAGRLLERVDRVQCCIRESGQSGEIHRRPTARTGLSRLCPSAACPGQRRARGHRRHGRHQS